VLRVRSNRGAGLEDKSCVPFSPDTVEWGSYCAADQGPIAFTTASDHCTPIAKIVPEIGGVTTRLDEVEGMLILWRSQPQPYRFASAQTDAADIYDRICLTSPLRAEPRYPSFSLDSWPVARSCSPAQANANNQPSLGPSLD
jgi:hypothetical protein